MINDLECVYRSGARWGLKGAEAVLRLRSLYASGDFDDYWQFHEGQERQRTHTSRYVDGIPAIRRPATSVTRRRRGLAIVK